MKKLLSFFFIGLLFTGIGYAQTDSVRWMLTSNVNADVFGNLAAADETFSNLVVRSYNGGACQKNAPTTTGDWVTETSENASRYLQFAVSPTTNYDFTVTAVKFYIGWAGTTSHMYANVYYSTDPTFSSRIKLGSTITLENSVGVLTSFPLNVHVNVGNTFYVRIYPWDNATATTKSCGLYDFGIFGSAVSTVTSSLSSNPSSLSFGSIHINTSKDKRYLLSGANLAPASGDITVMAPNGFKVSTSSGSGFASSILVSYIGGKLIDTTIYVRFIPPMIAAFNDSIIILGGGVTSKVLVAGTAVASDAMLGIFVSTTGNDAGPGTYDQPYLTISKAVSVALPGDSIFVRSGSYIINTSLNITSSGTLSDSIYLYAYPPDNARPLLDFSGMAYSSTNRGIQLSGQYWHIKGFEIYRAGDNGMNISGSNNIIEFCALFENRDSGMQLGGGASYNKIINCDSYFNYDSTGNPATAGGNADGFSPKLDVGTGNYFYGCRSWQNSDDGWDGYLRPATGVTTTLENCWSWKNGYLKDGVTTYASMNGNGIKMGGSDAKDLAHNFIVKNCLTFQNKAKGFDQNSNAGSITLYNCTAYNNVGQNFMLNSSSVTYAPGSVFTVINCAALGTSSTFRAGTILTANNFTTITSDYISIDTAGVHGPRKADGSLPDITFMHLAQGSQLIDAGTNIGLPYHGTAPDLGCFESDYPTSVANENNTRVMDFQLQQNYPNPFNPSTLITFYVGKKGFANLQIVNILGQHIQTLFAGQADPQKRYDVIFQASTLPSGVYFSILESNGERLIKKMMLVK